MRSRDLFAGCTIAASVHTTGWVLVLQSSGERPITVLVQRDLGEVLHAIHAWMLMMTDDTEVRHDPEVTVDELQEALARRALNEHPHPALSLNGVKQWDHLRAWYEREMGA